MAAPFDVAAALRGMTDTTWGRARRLEHDGQTVTRLLSSRDLILEFLEGGHAVAGCLSHNDEPYTPHVLNAYTLELRASSTSDVVRYYFRTTGGVFRMYEFTDTDSSSGLTTRCLYNSDGVSHERRYGTNPDIVDYYSPTCSTRIDRRGRIPYIDCCFRNMYVWRGDTEIRNGMFSTDRDRCLIWDHAIQILPQNSKDETD